MVNKNKEKKEVDKQGLVKRFEDKNKGIEIDLSTGTIKISHSLKYISLTDFICGLHKLRRLIKRLDYKTCERKGKYI